MQYKYLVQAVYPRDAYVQDVSQILLLLPLQNTITATLDRGLQLNVTGVQLLVINPSYLHYYNDVGNYVCSCSDKRPHEPKEVCRRRCIQWYMRQEDPQLVHCNIIAALTSLLGPR